MKTLYLDIETSPIVADVWSLWNQNVGLNQIHEVTRMISFSAKWAGKPVKFWGANRNTGDELAMAAYLLLDEADQVVTWNGDSFDLPHINRELLVHSLPPPSPYKSIDLYRQAKRKFRFPSNKLQYVSTALGFSGKVNHSGHSLWTKCLAGDEKAWKIMEKYNKQDVVLLEDLHNRMGPWIDGLNANLFDGEGCPGCGSAELRREGYAYTALGKYQRFQCKDCSKWSRSSTREAGTEYQAVR